MKCNECNTDAVLQEGLCIKCLGTFYKSKQPKSLTVAFELSMPSNNAWDGKGTGEGNCYAHLTKFGPAQKAKKLAEKIIAESPYRYDFGDGWAASIRARAVTPQEARRLRRETRGFCGYEWMIKSIRESGCILSD